MNNRIKKVVVTGGSGKAGRACLQDLKKQLGPNETLLSIEKARRVLGYEPQHSWRDPASRSH